MFLRGIARRNHNKRYSAQISFKFGFRRADIIFKYWFKGLIGILGSTDVRYPLGVYVITGVVCLSSFFLIQAEKKILIKSRVLAAGLIFLFFMIMLTTLFVTWNNPLRGKIGGFQGRYIISVLPLFFLLLARNSKFKYETYYKLFLLIFLGILLIYSCFFITAVY